MGPFVTKVRVVRARSLVRSSLPTLSSSSCEHNELAARGMCKRTVKILDNITLLGCTCRAVFRTFTLAGRRSQMVRTLEIISRGANVRKVLKKRDISIRGSKGPLRGRVLSCVCEGGASTLVRTSVVANTVLTKTGRRRMSTIRGTTKGVKLTFRVRSSVLSIADATRRLKGPMRDSRGGGGIACIALFKARGTTRRIRRLSRGTVSLLGDLGGGGRFLCLLVRGLVGHEGWEGSAGSSKGSWRAR